MSFNLTVQKDFDGDLSKREGFNCLPFIETPLTRTVDHNFTLQKGPCARYEMDFARCADRIGLERSLTDCKKYMQDMHECAHKLKALERYRIMQAERQKQGRPFMEAPPKDSVYVWTS